MLPWLPSPYSRCFQIWILLTSLFSKYSLYRDRQKTANGHNALLLRYIAIYRAIYRDHLHVLSHRHGDRWHSIWCTSRHMQSIYGTDRSLLIGHNALFLRQIAREPLHKLSHRHDNRWHSLWWTSRWQWRKGVSDMQIASELSKQAERTWVETPNLLITPTIL